MEDIAKKLISYQVPHLLQLHEAMTSNNCILDASDTGTGKTYTSLALALQMKLDPLIICPKSVIPSWLSAAKHFGMDIFGIANYELLKGCKYYTPELEKVVCPYMDRIEVSEVKKVKGQEKVVKKEDFIFQLPKNVMIIFDEAHRCKNYKTITSRLLVSIRTSGNKILLLSATITDKIPCFKPFGLVFGFYDDLKKYNMWMRRQIKMNKIKYKDADTSDDDIKLQIIHDNVFPGKGSRMKIKELGDLFPKNQITMQSYLCNDYDKVQKLLEVINDALEDLKKKELRAEALGKIIRARQKIEMYKVPIFVDLAEEALDNGYSVVIFVNYKDTMYTLAHHLKCDTLIHGDQNLDERQSCIDDFQANKRKVLIAIMQAGGVGISLHDIHGGHPRMSLISPTWTGQDMKQAFGRIHRAGSKTPAMQRVIFCAKTYEETICNIIKTKIKNIDAINDRDLMGPQFDKEEYTEIAEDIDHGNIEGTKLTGDKELSDGKKSPGNKDKKTFKKSKKTFKKKIVKVKKKD